MQYRGSGWSRWRARQALTALEPETVDRSGAGSVMADEDSNARARISADWLTTLLVTARPERPHEAV